MPTRLADRVAARSVTDMLPPSDAPAHRRRVGDPWRTGRLRHVHRRGHAGDRRGPGTLAASGEIHALRCGDPLEPSSPVAGRPRGYSPGDGGRDDEAADRLNVSLPAVLAALAIECSPAPGRRRASLEGEPAVRATPGQCTALPIRRRPRATLSRHGRRTEAARGVHAASPFRGAAPSFPLLRPTSNCQRHNAVRRQASRRPRGGAWSDPRNRNTISGMRWRG